MSEENKKLFPQEQIIFRSTKKMKITKKDSYLNITGSDFVSKIEDEESDPNLNPYLLAMGVAKRARQLTDEKAQIKNEKMKTVHAGRRNPDMKTEVEETMHEIENLYREFHPIMQATEEVYKKDVRIIPKPENSTPEPPAKGKKKAKQKNTKPEVITKPKGKRTTASPAKRPQAKKK